jgi:predicted GNAT family acetyltransferase
MNVDVIDNPEKHRFEAEVDGLMAVAEYRITGDVMTFTHTEVPSQFRGMGVGDALARGALDQARARGFTIRATCPFMAAYIKRHPA